MQQNFRLKFFSFFFTKQMNWEGKQRMDIGTQSGKDMITEKGHVYT